MRKYIVAGLLLACTNVYGWDNETTHKDISEAAAKLSLSSETQVAEYEFNGKKVSAIEWIKKGAELEDAGSIYALSKARYRNHFHNPLAVLTPPLGILTDGGLTDMLTGQSALFWAQDGANQANFEGGDWSWQTVRTHYYRSLTTTSKVGIEMFTAMTYLGLGYQIHLVQDMSQPDHVRNDAHPINSNIEGWAKDKRPLIKGYAATATNASKPAVDLTQPLFTDYAPVGRLMDTRRYIADRTPTDVTNQGMAEYTNANFFSHGTIFAARYNTSDKHYFPYPRREGTDIQKYFDGTKAPETVISEDGKSIPGLWISKVGEGEKVTHFVRVTAAAEAANFLLGEGSAFYSALGRDEIVYEDYARLLIPRAVGYSAALLDYFFRGKINLSFTPTDISFRSIKVTVQNNTPVEDMGLGDIALVIRYKALAEKPDGGRYILENPPEGTAISDYTYKVIKPSNQVNLKDPMVLTFDLSSDPLPMYFDDMTMQLVYKGPLGNETGAVAVSEIKQIDGIYSDFAVSLPPSGVYAKVAGESIDGTFNELRLTATTDIPGGLTGGSFKLYLEHTVSKSDPYQSVPVAVYPDNAAGYLIKADVSNGITSLAQGVPTELVFNLTTPLPVKAADVHIGVVYQMPDDKRVAIGVNDISEPTPVDIFNNTDYSCVANQWYNSGTQAARTAADQARNKNGLDDDMDTYPHNFTNIYAKASPSGSTVKASATVFDFLEAGPVTPNTFKRLGYILTDYTFKYSLLKTWIHSSAPQDGWTTNDVASLYSGTGFVNQSDRGYGIMYTIRGNKMWWGAGKILDNLNTIPGSSCDWSQLPLQ